MAAFDVRCIHPLLHTSDEVAIVAGVSRGTDHARTRDMPLRIDAELNCADRVAAMLLDSDLGEVIRLDGHVSRGAVQRTCCYCDRTLGAIFTERIWVGKQLARCVAARHVRERAHRQRMTV